MKNIVISGTYCTGKTTLSLALEKATGISTTHALTMREILPILYPGKSLRQCNYAELITLGMRRFEDRIRSEASLPGRFISDGCPLQEWLYGSTRLITGAYPDEYPWKMKLKKLWHYRSYRDFEKLLTAFEGMVKAYTRSHYDLFFHLPVEFPFVADGHRPTSERFRMESEKRLLATYTEMGISPIILSGSMEERINKALEALKIVPQYPIEYYIRHATLTRRDRFDKVNLET
ncbi:MULTISPECIES: ATP-binding protein [Sphingobacterium]|uniref:ATP/GTP-binding protein n=1 Tax=Sphingobacterium TaxID=28453 RepID=UPI0013DC2E36|nr:MULTISPECIES: ATP-binding protein [unclassified Sphingobacterium]